MNALRMPQGGPAVILWMRMQRRGMWATMKRREDVRGNVQLKLAIGREERLFRAKIEHGEGRVGGWRDGKILALRFGCHLLLFIDEGHFFALSPSVVTSSVILQPEDEIKVLRGMLHVEEIFFQVLETNRREMSTREYILEADIEDGGDATRAYLAYSRGWVTEAILGQNWSEELYDSKLRSLTGRVSRPLGPILDGGG